MEMEQKRCGGDELTPESSNEIQGVQDIIWDKLVQQITTVVYFSGIEKDRGGAL